MAKPEVPARPRPVRATTPTEVPESDLEQQRALAETIERMGRINGLLRKTAADHIKTGLELIQLHKSLPHGWKARLYSGSEEPLPEELRARGVERLDITQGDGEQLIRIAKNQALSDSRNFEKLPWATSTLDVLSKLPPDVLQAAIDRGEIHRGLKRDQADQLVARLTGQPEAEGDDVDDDWKNGEMELRRLREHIFAAVEPWIARCPLDQDYLSVAEKVLREVAEDLQEGREWRRRLVTLRYRRKPLEGLIDTQQRLEELAQKRAAAIENGERSLADASIRKVVVDLGLPESYTAQRAIRVVQHVLAGRICGPPERDVMVKAMRGMDFL